MLSAVGIFILVAFAFRTIFSFSFLTASSGVGVNLLKIGAKRRRTKQEIEDQREAELLEKQSIQAKLAQMESLIKKCNELRQKADNNEAANMILNGFLSNGMAQVDENGIWSVPSGLDQSLQLNQNELAPSQSDQQMQSSLINQ